MGWVTAAPIHGGANPVVRESLRSDVNRTGPGRSKLTRIPQMRHRVSDGLPQIANPAIAGPYATNVRLRVGIAVLAAIIGMAAAGTAQASERIRSARSCGTVDLLSEGTYAVDVVAQSMRCRKARRIARRWLVKEYWDACDPPGCIVLTFRCTGEARRRQNYAVRCAKGDRRVRFRREVDQDG